MQDFDRKLKDGNDFISLNCYPNIKDGLLKACDMPKEKVIYFIVRMKVDDASKG